MRQPPLYLLAALVVGILPLLRSAAPSIEGAYSTGPQTTRATPATMSAQYSVASLSGARLPNPSAVEKAVRFIQTLQPEGTYILTSAGSYDVVHMDVAHSAIALAKVGHGGDAKGAMDWLLGQMTLAGSPERYRPASVDGATHVFDYAGSWWDHYRPDGEPRRDLTRGRGEGVGMVLIATYSIFQEDPSYLRHRINGVSVIDRVALAARYLAGPAIQKEDGQFNHRPDYQVSFGEEGARMILGLRLASDMLAAQGRLEESAQAADHAERGLAALLRRDDINEGMAFDYYALSIWGMATPEQAHEEFSSVREAELLSPDGVRNWDWQIDKAKSLLNRLRWWATSQSIAPAQTFDWAIANVTMGNVEEARRIEQRWLPLQRDDGGFSGVYLPGLKAGFGEPTSYTAARFILLERMLAEARAQERSLITN